MKEQRGKAYQVTRTIKTFEYEWMSMNDWAVLWVLVCTVHLTDVLIMSRTRFRVNPHYIVAWMSRNSLLAHSSIIWPVWLNGWVFIYELSGCGFKSRCNHLNFRFRACFEQGVPSHSGNYRVWIHSETRTWYDKNIQ